MTFLTRTTAFARLTQHADLAAAALCLVPTVGFLLALNMQVDLATFTAFVTVPALIALMAIETWMAQRAPQLLKRVAAGLAGGLVATLMADALRLPAAYLVKGAPDWVPMIGQHLTHEIIGIAPSLKAVALGYGYHYLLVGAMLGAAFALVAGRVRRNVGLAAGLVAGVAFASMHQFQLLSVGTGFAVEVAMAIVVGAFGVAGLTLGAIVEAATRPAPQVLGFWREGQLQAK